MRVAIVTINELTDQIVEFRDDREWKQFHTPKDIAISLLLEASELLEITQWKNGAVLDAHLTANKDALGDELVDVLYYTLLLAHDQGIDLTLAFERKMAMNAEKYPVALARGSSTKYTKLAEPLDAD